MVALNYNILINLNYVLAIAFSSQWLHRYNDYCQFHFLECKHNTYFGVPLRQDYAGHHFAKLITNTICLIICVCTAKPAKNK